MDGLYTGRAWNYQSPDPVRGVTGGNDSSGAYIIVARSSQDAEKKLITYLNSNSRRWWESPEVFELHAREDLPLETRLEILGEIRSIIR